MKNLTVIVLLVINLFVSAMPYYNQENTALTKTEKQFEEILFSEIFTNNISKHTVILNFSGVVNYWFIKTYPKNAFLFNFKVTKIVLIPCKYGLQVLFSSFLN